jgi:hypothetical protein
MTASTKFSDLCPKVPIAVSHQTFRYYVSNNHVLILYNRPNSSMIICMRWSKYLSNPTSVQPGMRVHIDESVVEIEHLAAAKQQLTTGSAYCFRDVK